jgi:hypothetical protein
MATNSRITMVRVKLLDNPLSLQFGRRQDADAEKRYEKERLHEDMVVTASSLRKPSCELSLALGR